MAFSARMMFGIAGDVTSLVLYLSPLGTFIGIRRNGSVGECSSMPYLAALLNCAVWLLYALPMVHANSTPVIIISGIGILIELSYVVVFLYYAAGLVRRNVSLWLFGVFIFVGLVAILVFVVVQRQEHRSMITGLFGVASSIGMYASPLIAVYQVYQSGSVERMDRNVSLASVANSICWIIYALLPLDLYILVPNLLGFLCAGVQLIVYVIFNTFKDDAFRIEIELV